jgi:hypothetical protein
MLKSNYLFFSFLRKKITQKKCKTKYLNVAQKLACLKPFFVDKFAQQFENC